MAIDQKAALLGGVSGDCDAPGFPVTICAPGSYILVSDLKVATPNTDGIDIAVPNVTIDLNGFTISGPETCTGTGSSLRCRGSITGWGIAATANTITGNMTVRNGTVRGFGLLGVNLTGIGNMVDRITASENGAVGIYVWQGTVTNSSSNRNGTGFVCFAGQLSHNTAYGNGGDGLSLNRCGATDNATNYNAG